MNAAVLEKLDELIVEQKRSNELLGLLLKRTDAVSRMDLVGDTGPGLELIAGELLPMNGSVNGCEVLKQVLATAIREAQANAFADPAAKAVEAANAFKAGLAAFNAVAKEVSE